MRFYFNLRSFFLLTGIFLVLQLQGLSTSAQTLGTLGNNEVFATFEGKLNPALARAGEEVRVVILANIEEGWHIYSVIPSEDELAPPPTKIEWNNHAFINKGPVYETNPIVQNDPVLGMLLAYHEENAQLYQNFQIPDDFSAGSYQLEGSIQYQTCSDKICLPPKIANLTIPFKVEDGPVRPAFAYMNRVIDEIPAEGTFLPTADSLESALSEGFWAFIVLAALMGALTWLTPCVFPMIPVTVSFFSKQAEESRQRLLTLAVIFSLGIVVTYTGTGLLLAGFMGAAGAAQLATNPWVNLAIAILFIIFALSLMGAFDLRMPFSWVQSLDRLSRQGGGIAGVSLMGMVFTLTAFTCTVQFVGTLLIAAAQGDWIWPIIGMLIFSSVFAFPFFLLALFPRLVQSFQSKSGPWMVQFKVILGLVELMAAFKFLSNSDLVWGWGIVNRTVVLGAWTLLVIGMILVIFGKFPVFGVKRIHVRFSHFLFTIPLIGLALYLGNGALGQSLDGWTESYLPPELNRQQAAISSSRGTTNPSVEKVHNLPWHNNLQEALSLAKKEQKPLFIDFTGYTCVNCRWMETNVFAEPSVYAILKDQFVLVQLYTDGGEGYEVNQKLQIERFNTIALPFYVILSPENAVLAKRAGINSPSEFLKFLEQGQTMSLSYYQSN